MSLMSLEKRWKSALTSILEHLTESQFKKMLFDLDRIPQGVKADKVREEIPQIIIQYFGVEESITVIDKEMKQIPRMDAAVQDQLRPFVEKLKKQRQKNLELKRKAAADSGPAAQRKTPAADKPMSCKPAKADPVGAVKPKQKKTVEKDLTLKPTGTTKTPKADPVGAVKPIQKKTVEKDLTHKPTGTTKTPKADPVGAVKPKQKKPQKDLTLKPTGTTKTSKPKPSL